MEPHESSSGARATGAQTTELNASLKELASTAERLLEAVRRCNPPA